MFILERRKANGYSGNQPEFAGVPVSDAGTAGSGLSVLSGERWREQVNRWNAKLSNGFRLDLERFIVWNDKLATRSIELPDGKVLKADIGWTEVREEPRLGCFYQKTIGMMPRLSLSLWTPSSTPGMWCSRGLGAVVKITDNIYQKRNWNELAKFTAEWGEKRLLEEAKKHMAELQNDVVA